MKCPRRDDAFRAVSAYPTEDHWRPDGSCSYCGSLNPDTFLARLEAGDVELGPTDKSYKVYVESTGGERLQTKFYFQHLSEDQKRRFIELHNDGKMKIGYPGRFYVLPFFCGRTPPAAA